MHGRRVSPDQDGNMSLGPGDYGKLGGVWWVRPPRGGSSILPSERVIEHEDGTISVRGLVQLPAWNGRLERGVWIEEC